MQRKSPADCKRITRKEMTDEEKEIDDLLVKETELSKEIRLLEGRMAAEMKLMRQAMEEKAAGYLAQLKEMRNSRKERRDRILAYWDKHHPKQITLIFPSVLVSKRNYRHLTINNESALLSALDRAGRLDLVEYVFKENVVARLVAEGELPGLDESAVEVTDNIELQIRPGKGTDHGR